MYRLKSWIHEIIITGSKTVIQSKISKIGKVGIQLFDLQQYVVIRNIRFGNVDPVTYKRNKATNINAQPFKNLPFDVRVEVSIEQFKIV